MSCCQQCDQSGLGALASFYGLRGLGEIPQQMAAIAGGSPFEFGFNIGIGVVGRDRAGELASVLDDLALSYDTHSWWHSGTLNPYIVIEGNAVTTWSSASDFGEAIYQAVVGAGFPIDYGSIQFRAEPYSGSGQTAPPPMVGTPHPTTGGGTATTTGGGTGAPPPPPGKCEWEKMTVAEYLACQLGVTKSSAMAYGAIAALVAVIVIGKAVK